MPTLPTTIDEILDRMSTVVKGVVPTVNDHDLFKPFADRDDGVFESACEAAPESCTRKFQVRELGVDRSAAVSNCDVEEREAVFIVTVAYAQTSRLGRQAARARAAAIRADKLLLERELGPCGRDNFAPPYPDACWRKETSWGEVTRTERIRGDKGVDYLVLTIAMSFVCLA